MVPVENITSLNSLIDEYDAFLLDAYGVFWSSPKLIPGTKETMQHLLSLRKQVGILSNSTQLSLKEKAKYAKHGLIEGTHYHFLLTSGEVTRNHLLSQTVPFPTPNNRYFLFGSDHPRFSPHSLLFQETKYHQTLSLDEADFIYIAIPHINGVDQEDPLAFREDIERAAATKIPVLCANPDTFAHEGNPARLVVRQGTIAEEFEKQGSPVYSIGKPFLDVYEEALQFFPHSIPKKRILMVGDTPQTDIRGANACGIASALVTQTGITADAINKTSFSSVIDSLSLTDRPSHIIDTFRLYEF